VDDTEKRTQREKLIAELPGDEHVIGVAATVSDDFCFMMGVPIGHNALPLVYFTSRGLTIYNGQILSLN
jgi:hypothetical protein